MKMKSLFLLAGIILLGATTKTQAQYYFYNEDYYDNPVLYEVGGSIGTMNCLTDLGGHKGLGKKFLKDLNFGSTQLCASAYFGMCYKNSVGLRVEYTAGMVKAYDSVLKDDVNNPRYSRNLSFRSKISEVSVIAEFYPTYIFRKFDTDVEPPRLSPYFMIGIGFFHFNPQAIYNGEWVDLQPLHTEGQGFAEYSGREQYSLSQTNIPLGLGVKYELSPRFNVRAEMLYRKLHTDYLDDVSTNYVDPAVFSKYLSGPLLAQALALNNRSADTWGYSKPGDIRGNPESKDAYFTFNLKIGIIFGRQKIQ
jgi:hypothetical protein